MIDELDGISPLDSLRILRRIRDGRRAHTPWRVVFASLGLVALGAVWKVAKYRFFVDHGIDSTTAAALVIGPLALVCVVVLVVAWRKNGS